MDAAGYEKAVTEFCPFMPESEVDPHCSVYLLHRGWKFYFCCWSGCGDQFLRDPSAWYDYYGLADKDGKLVRVRQTAVAYSDRPTAEAGADEPSVPVESGVRAMVLKVPDMMCKNCAASIGD